MTAVATEAGVTEALRRSAVYRVLALAFAPPVAERLAEVAAASAGAAAGTRAAVADALARLAAAAHADPADLATAYLGLFDRTVRCPLYEGAYGPPRLGGKAAMLADVAGFYTAFGLAPASAQPDMEDHVAAELEFMSLLALKEAWALAEGLDEALAVTRHAQAAFVGQHLGPFAPALAARIAELAPPGFYPAAAAALTAWVDDECGRLGVAPAPLEGLTEAEVGPLTCPMATESGSAGLSEPA